MAKRVPILESKLNLSAAEYYILEDRVLNALKQQVLTLDVIKTLISRAQCKYFELRLNGYNFNQIAVKLNVDSSAVTQACKRAVIFVTEYLNKSNIKVA